MTEQDQLDKCANLAREVRPLPAPAEAKEKEILETVADLAKDISENSIDNSMDAPGDLSEKQAKYAWLKPYQYKPGQSGNRGGRPKSTPVSDATEWAANLPFPSHKKRELENALKMKLRNDLTNCQAAALILWQRAGSDIRLFGSLAELIEGPKTQKVELGSQGGMPFTPPMVMLQAVKIERSIDGERIIELEPAKPIDVKAIKSNATNGNSQP